MITSGQRKIIKNIKRRWAHIWFGSETHGICLCFYAWLCKFKLKQKPLSQTVVKNFGMLFIWCFPTSTSIPYISILIVCWSQCSSHNNPKNQKLFRSTTHSIILILMYSYLRSFFFFFFSQNPRICTTLTSFSMNVLSLLQDPVQDTMLPLVVLSP